jgi:hypothetical protein
MQHRFSRRAFVRGVAGSTVVGASGVQLLLQACIPAPVSKPTTASSSTSAKPSAGQLPTFVAFKELNPTCPA